ncbi:hypothetical protein [Azospirillum sp. ST 5-10]|uniref:hypothetical protein n=1 Tax=unclassified Azospirillum TaxID=2630922 RepID=UPI003F49BB69
MAAVLFLLAFGAAAAEVGIVKIDWTAIHEVASRTAAKIGVVDHIGSVDVLEKGKKWVKVKHRTLGVEG